MEKQNLNNMLNDEDLKKYAKEAEEKYGNTEAYKQSHEKMKKIGIMGMMKIARELDRTMKELVKHMDKGIKSPEVQKLIEEHYNSLSSFYEPNLQMYREMGKMYVQDQRFSAFFEKYQKGLAEFMRDAINFYCDEKK